MNNALETYVNKFNNGFSVTEVFYDQDSSREDMGDCEPEIFVADNGRELSRRYSEEFGNRTPSLSGSPLKRKDGSWYYGISMYSHGGKAFALAGSSRQRGWPDQQWDVVPVVGWVKLTKKLRDDWGIGDDEEAALRNVESSLSEYEAYCNGWVYGIVCTWYEYVDEPQYGDQEVFDVLGYLEYEEEGKFCREIEGEGDNCWGYVGWEYTEQEAKETGSNLPSKLVEAGWLSE